MKRRKIAMSVLVLTLFMASLQIEAGEVYAAKEERLNSSWSELAETDWYNDTDTEFTINTAEQLAGLSAIVNGTANGIKADSFENKTVRLGADISLDGFCWVPVGTEKNPFSGSFDGGGAYTISDMNLTVENADTAGLFGYVKDASIQNLTIISAQITAAASGMQRAGLLAGWAVNTAVSGVTVSGRLNVTLSEKAQFSSFGGLIGLTDYAADRLTAGGCIISDCTAKDISISYSGCAGMDAAYQFRGSWNTSYYFLPVSFGGLIGAQGNPYIESYGSHSGISTKITDCTVEKLSVVRSAGNGSIYEAIGGIIGTARTKASVQDCSVEGFTAQIASDVPDTEMIGSRGNMEKILAGLYLGGVAGIFDGNSVMLRCQVIGGKVFSDVTGGYKDDADKRGGFYGGMAGMLGFPPGWEDDGSWSKQSHTGLGAVVKSCYCEMEFSADNSESVRYVSSVRSLRNDGKIDVQYLVCNINGVSVLDSDNDFVCGRLQDSGKATTSEYQLHPVKTQIFNIGETKEPFDYRYHYPNSSGSFPQSSMSDASQWHDKIEMLDRSYRADSSVLSGGNNTDKLTFSKAGVHDVTVPITDSADNEIFLEFTLPVVVKEPPIYAVAASPSALDFGSVKRGGPVPAMQEVTIINTGNQTMTVVLPVSENYVITAGSGDWNDGTVTLAENDAASFTVQPKSGLDTGSYNEVIAVSAGNGVEAGITLRFTVNAGGSGGDTQYIIAASAGEGGTISPSGKVSVARGSDKTFIITADEKYVIADVTVDGKSAGAVDSYTFKDVREKHTIEVVFKKEREVVSPDDTGVSDQLNTLDHEAYFLGYPDGTFRPDNNMTRAEAAQMFYNLLLDKDTAVSVSFADVSDGAWYAKAVNTLGSLGVITGIGNGQYVPERSITRAEFTAIAMRFAKLRTEGENIFSDISENAWYCDYVTGAVQYGWITGYPNGTFRPEQTITRAETTAVVNRMLGRSADTGYVNRYGDRLIQFSDVRASHWAYYQITEASNAHDYVKIGDTEEWTSLL